MILIELMQDSSEIVHYEQNGIPLYIRTANLSIYPDLSAPCHWHDDIEWIHIIHGKMCYYINGSRLVLNTNDSLMINSRQMHYGYAFENQDCRFSCVLFHPSLFGNNPTLLKKYVTPVLENSCPEYLHFCSEQENGKEISKILNEITDLKEHSPIGYEMEVIALMQRLWASLLQKEMLMPEQNNPAMQGDLRIQKDMVSFIYQHYHEKITLEEIACAGHVSRSKCCRIFKHYLQQTPIDFLNSYRLRVSCQLLCTTEQSVTEIALACGFNHLSYFSKNFYQVYGCTPREYRNQKISDGFQR